MTAYVQNELIKARIADMHGQAQQDRIVQAVRRARRAQRKHDPDPTISYSIFAHRLRAALERH
jgi:hypothetical protein